MKILIIPGFAKSGTTFLYDQIQHLKDHINMPVRKEIDYFRRGDSLDEYMKCFETQDPDKVFLDASPQYSTAPDRVVRNAAAALKGHEVKVLFCLREPLSRAYSHYLHDLSAMFWVSALAANDFFHPDIMSKYLIAQKDIVEKFAEGFGKDNLSGFGFKVSGKKLPDDIREFLNLPASYRLNTDTNPAPGSILPKVYYNPEKTVPVISEGEFYLLPPKHLMIVNGQWTQLFEDFPEALARKILINVSQWCWRFDPAHLGEQTGQLRENYLKIFDLLGMEREKLGPVATIIAKTPTAIEKSSLSRLKRWGSTQDAVDIDMDSEKRKEYAQTLSATMRLVANATMAKDDDAQTRNMEFALSEYGPLPMYVTAYLRNLMAAGEPQKAIDYIEANPEIHMLCQLGHLHKPFNHFGKKFDEEAYLKLGSLIGIRGLKWTSPNTPAKKPVASAAAPVRKADIPTKSVTEVLGDAPIEIFSHHHCETEFVEAYLQSLCIGNELEFAFNDTQSKTAKPKISASVLVLSLDTDYKSVAKASRTGLHIIRNPLNIVAAAYRDCIHADSNPTQKKLLKQRKAIAAMPKNDGIWATIKMLEAPGGALHALKSWDLKDSKFYTVRCEDFIKFPRRCLVKNWSLLHPRTENLAHAYKYPNEDAFRLELEKNQSAENIDPVNYRNTLDADHIKTLIKSYGHILEAFYPASL